MIKTSYLQAIIGLCCAFTVILPMTVGAADDDTSPEQEPSPELVETPNDESNHTVITSKKLTYDKEKSFALFEENVVVTDPQIKIMSSLLRVVFNANDQVVKLEAEGNVRMAQEDKVATSEKATYDMEDGKIVLQGKPVVRRGTHEISGDTITFWRNDNRMLVEPNARVKIGLENDEQGGMGFIGQTKEQK